MPLLTEQKLRIAIREEIENSIEYRNLSPRQKQLLEEGVLKKVGSVVGKLVKGAAGIAGGLIKNIFKGLFQGGGQFDKDAKALAAKLTAFQQQRIKTYKDFMAFAKGNKEHENMFRTLIYDVEKEDDVTELFKELNLENLITRFKTFQTQRGDMHRELMAFVDSKNRSENFDRETVRKGFEQLIYNAKNEDLTTDMIKSFNQS